MVRFGGRGGEGREGEGEDPATPWSLSPTDLAHIPAGTRLVLPSPNGAALPAAAADIGATLIAGCLRNAAAVGNLLADEVAAGRYIAVIASAVDAGALPRSRVSPEARAAMAAFRSAEPDLHDELRGSVSGRELLNLGWDDDVASAAQLNADPIVPVLHSSAFSSSADQVW